MEHADPADERERRSVVPASARRTLWLAAVWTGLGAAIVCVTAAIVVVAVCWLPVAGSSGRTNSAIRAGLLTFLSGLHGGLTVDGVDTSWVPLGMTAIIGLVAWRAGCGLADAAAQLDERDTVRLALAGLAQAGTFAIACLVAVPFATLGTSRAPFLGVAVASLVLFLATGGVAFVRFSPLASRLQDLPVALSCSARAGAAAVAAHLTCGAVLVAGSIALHHQQVETLSGRLGGGLSGVPVLLLGILAVPNAAIAASSYLAGPGFSVGSGTSVTMFGATHGTVPAFPVLGAMPGSAAGPTVLVLAVVTVLAAGAAAARGAWARPSWSARFATAGAGALAAGVIMAVLGWLGGGAIGDGRLAVVGASPWQLGGAIAVGVAVGAAFTLAVAAGWQALAGRRVEDEDLGSLIADLVPRRTPRLVPPAADTDDRPAAVSPDADREAG